MKLSTEAVVTLKVLRQQGESNADIARRLGITEGAVRYHLRKQSTVDGRSKASRIESLGLVEVVDHWWQDQLSVLPGGRSPNVHSLWTMLVDEHGYDGSYKSVRKFVRAKYPAAPKRPFRRVETPSGAQVQSDWMELKVRLSTRGGGDEAVTVYGFVMTLSHSRKTAVIFSSSMNQLAWHTVHNEAFKRLGGVAAVNRIDNLKTGVARGGGATAVLNESYRAYARTMGFHVDPHQVRQPQQKGKVERRVGVFKTLDLSRVFDSLDALQRYADETLARDSVVRKCPVTGKSVHESWLAEKLLLRPLPETLPAPFDAIKQAQVHKDCTIRFEGRTYAVPYRFVGGSVEVRGCSETVQIVDSAKGEIVKVYPRKTEESVLIDASCYESNQRGNEASPLPPPLPLGAIGEHLQRIADEGVTVRSIDVYDRIASARSGRS